MQRSTNDSRQLPYKQLKERLQELPVPKNPIPYKQGETIQDVSLFLSSHFKYIDSNAGNKVVYPYYSRLLEYYEFIIQKNK